VADLRALRAKHFRAAGTLDTADIKVKRWLRTTDSRNFSAQVSVADLEKTYVSGGRTFRAAEENARVIVVASHGNFDAARDNAMGLGMIGGQRTAKPVSITSDLDIFIIDATTGQFFGEFLVFPGCHAD
jgi:hypothetical protein